ncbi:MAG TPA: hypothetical protein VGY13_09165 [Solirubrobacteraceae bacterium]|jgi:hypothetical protein|nr:hypothetical protein [Solirubrobacteraceae bacterium]
MAADLLDRVHGEIAERMEGLRPAAEEYERLLEAARALERGGPGAAPARPPARPSQPRAGARQPPPAPARPAGAPGAGPEDGAVEDAAVAEKAIVAALEHGSHTVGELGIVTAMSGREIRAGARRLLDAGRIARTTREGRTAYALSGSE